MLVGDRGRVIPFRHFKGIALGVCCISFLLLLAFIVMSILYIGQGRKLTNLESELENAKLQNSKLRDEKDLYLTKLMLTQQQEQVINEKTKPVPPAKPVESKPEEVKTSAKADPETNKAPVAPAIKKAPEAKPPAPKVQWKADIRRFSVSYDAKQEVLRAQFRVYNTSKPKKRLSGKSVVVFKVQDDPPVKWMPVPRVQLSSGEPSGKRGQSFRVKNYLTMKFRAYRQKTPISFNTATVYVYSEDGSMLASKDFAFKIETPPPPPLKKQPVQAAPAVKAPPAVKKEQPDPQTPQAEPERRQTAQPTTSPAIPPAQEKTPAAPERPVSSDAAAPVPAPGTGQLPDVNPSPAPPNQEPDINKPADIVTTPPSSGPPSGASDIPIQPETPSEAEQTETAPQPKVEGETR